MTSQYISQSEESGIPIFRFSQVTRPALDEYLAVSVPVLRDHIDLYQDKIPFCYILDLSETGMFPVKYMMDKASAEIAKLPYRPQHYIAYVVTDPRDNMLVDIIQQLTARNLEHTRKVFTTDQKNDAVNWLSQLKASFLTGDA